MKDKLLLKRMLFHLRYRTEVAVERTRKYQDLDHFVEDFANQRSHWWRHPFWRIAPYFIFRKEEYKNQLKSILKHQIPAKEDSKEEKYKKNYYIDYDDNKNEEVLMVTPFGANFIDEFHVINEWAKENEKTGTFIGGLIENFIKIGIPALAVWSIITALIAKIG